MPGGEGVFSGAWPTQASFAWVGVFVVTTKIPALAKRRLERGTQVISLFAFLPATLALETWNSKLVSET